MDITPKLSADANLIRNYGPVGFTIAETLYPSAILLRAEGVEVIESEIDFSKMLKILREERQELLLYGTGKEMQIFPEAWKASLRAAGISSEAMDTGAACRTYNVLLGEGRRVAALLLPVQAA